MTRRAWSGTSSTGRNGLGGAMRVTDVPLSDPARPAKSRVGSNAKREYCERCGQKKRACRCVEKSDP